ncbi:retrovirus-related pol polyprotein from transposon TNT 1-94 [Tanacetum coccineum]
MSEKEKDPEAIKQNISHKTIDYEKLNRLSEDFGKRFTPQQELSAEQAFWLRMSNPTSKPSDASPIKIEAPKELPKVSLVNETLKKLKFHLARFDNMVKIRTTLDARTGGMFKLDLEPLAPRLLHNREAHIDYLKYTQEQADILREIVEQAKAKQPLDNKLDFACKHAQRIQELLVYVRETCPNVIKLSAKKVAVTPKNNIKKVRFIEPLTSSSSIKQVESSTTSYSNIHVLSLKSFTSNCGSKPTGNKKNDRISRTPSRNIKNKVEAQPRKVNKKNHVVEPICSSKKAKIVESKNANHSEPNHTWGSNATDIPSSSSLVMTDNGTEFVNQTLHEFYENVGISHQTSVARTPQQNGYIERRNRTLVEAARTMLIFSKASLFLWAEAINTACYTQNCSLIRLRYNKTPYELMQDKKPDLSFFYVFGTLCYPTNDNDDLEPGKLLKHFIWTFDEVYSMASKQYQFRDPGFMSVTPATSISGLCSKPYSTQPLNSIHKKMIGTHSFNLCSMNTSLLHQLLFLQFKKLLQPRVMVIDVRLFNFHCQDAPSTLEPKNFKQAMTESSWIDAMQEEIHEFQRLEVWELVLDQTYNMQQLIAEYQAKPTEKHLNAVKQIFRYLKGTINMGLWYSKDTGMSLTAYADADHAGCQDTRRSTSGSA